MKGILSSNIEHYRHTAEALKDIECLETYISGAFYKKKPWYYFFSGSLKGWIDGRIETQISSKYIKSLTNQEILYKIIRNSKVNKYIDKSKIDLLFNSIFDYRSKFELKKKKKIDFYHYVSSIGYRSAIEAKKKFNCKIIVDDRAEHKEYLYNILQQEYINLEIKFDDDNFWDIDCRKDYEIADYIITPSTFSKQTFINQGIPKEKLVVIPYGCDTRQFYPLEKTNKDKFRIIYVGSVCIRKGAHYLIDAFRNIKNNDIELLIIGKIEPELENYMSDLPENIRHIEYIPNKDLNKYYSESDIFILPSLSDSFSLATLEAMSSGLPVIVSENVGAKDFIKNGENGYIIPIRDSNEIREKIISLYNDRKQLKYMSINARKTVEGITWEQYKKNIMKFYKTI